MRPVRNANRSSAENLRLDTVVLVVIHEVAKRLRHARYTALTLLLEVSSDVANAWRAPGAMIFLPSFLLDVEYLWLIKDTYSSHQGIRFAKPEETKGSWKAVTAWPRPETLSAAAPRAAFCSRLCRRAYLWHAACFRARARCRFFIMTNSMRSFWSYSQPSASFFTFSSIPWATAQAAPYHRQPRLGLQRMPSLPASLSFRGL